MMKFEILVFDGFEEMDVFGVFEVLAVAGFDTRLCSRTSQKEVTGYYGTKLIPHGVLDLACKPDVLIVPGGGWLAKAAKGAWAEAQNGETLSLLRSFQSSGSILCAVCTGTMLLAKAGLLKDRPATTNKAAFKELETFGVDVVQARVVDDGDIVTAGGITSSLDLGLWLVERFAGAEKALAVSNKLEFELRGPIFKCQEMRMK